jgi:hypothetical protein
MVSSELSEKYDGLRILVVADAEILQTRVWEATRSEAAASLTALRR